MKTDRLRNITHKKLEAGNVSICLDDKEIIQAFKDIDGFYVISFDGHDGYWSGWILLQLGLVLNDINKVWDEQVKRDLGNCHYCKGTGIDPDNLTGNEELVCPACHEL